MLLLTIDNVPGKQIEALGMVTGGCIMCKNIGKDIGSSFRNIVGGKMQAYTEMMLESKDNATNNMIAEAKAMGADAIIGIRFSSTTIVQGGAEILASGTAVKFI